MQTGVVPQHKTLPVLKLREEIEVEGIFFVHFWITYYVCYCVHIHTNIRSMQVDVRLIPRNGKKMHADGVAI